MTDEKQLPVPRPVKTVFVGEESLPTHYVNMVNVRAGLEEFFLTLGTVLPLDITDSKDLENIDSISAHPLFRCAVSRSVMKQLIDLMTDLYENQTQQIEQVQTSQRGGEGHGDNNS